jgi:hypothetical protein
METDQFPLENALEGAGLYSEDSSFGPALVDLESSYAYGRS